jgi:hypothetical protein
MLAVAALQRQDKANRLAETPFEYTPEPLAFFRIIEFVVFRIAVLSRHTLEDPRRH